MNKLTRVSAMPIVWAVLSILVTAVPAFSAAIGTTSQSSITNGVFNSGDTVPQAAGRLSIAYKLSTSNADSRFVGFNSSGVSVVVDTGYDISVIGTPPDSIGGIGDTISFAYGVTNLSNATIRVYIDSVYHPLGQSDSGPGSDGASSVWDISGSYKAYYDLNNNGLWTTGDTTITFLDLASGASDTFVVVVIIPTSANNGETSTTAVMVTDRAPIVSPSTTGDAWQDSRPISTNDSRDTQYDTTVTTVAGPNVFVSKTMLEASGSLSRPGDTLIVLISFDNDGNDTARGVEIMDAVPSNTRFVRNSADSVELSYQWSRTGAAPYTYTDTAFVVYYDTDDLGTSLDFKDTFTAFETEASRARLVSAIKWNINQPIGANNGDANAAVNIDLTKNDNGRIYFKVVIR